MRLFSRWRTGSPGAVIAMLLVCLLGGTVGQSRAHAEDKAVAREHWERGTKFYDLGKYDDAIKEFEAAYEAKGDPAFLYNLAQSHRLAGHPNDALRFYRTYLRYVPKAQNRDDIEQRIKELEKVSAEHPGNDATTTTTTTTATATSTATTPPTTTWPAPAAAGNPPPAAPPPTAAIPGEAAAPANAGPSGAAYPPGTMGSAPPTAATAATAAAAAHVGSSRRTAGIVIAASGGGLIVVGAVFGLVAKSQSKKVESAADNGEAFDPAVQRLGKNAQALQWVGYILGAAAVATGAILYATAPRASTDEAAPQPPRMALGPLAGPGMGGALLRLSF